MVTEEEQNDLLFEMANLHSNTHGIPDVVIWVGQASKQHGLRVKVSNQKNKWNKYDNFIIMMPSLDYDPKAVASWIDYATIEKIKEWIKLNQKILYDYETGELDDTLLFIQQIAKM